MNLAAFKTTNEQKLRFQFQSIVDVYGADQDWTEMFYRPQHFSGHSNIEQYFKSLTPQLKVDLDIKIFNQLSYILINSQPGRLSINVMPNSLLNSDFRNNLKLLIDSQAIDPSHICIEIIETHSMSPLNTETLELLKYFKSKGGLIALDDFGSGFAHWELLQTGLIDVLKVAKQNFNCDKNTEQFIQGLADFAKTMKITTVLEGVETQNDYDLGREQGFQNFQGWFFDANHTGTRKGS